MKKRTSLLFCAFIFSLSVLGAIPKYTDLNNARKLATVLQYASIGTDFFVSVDIRKAGENRFFLEGIARNGKIYKLTMDYLYRLSKTETIFLKNNNVLIFPYKDNSTFVLFNRKDFRQIALNAKTYNKSYYGDDPLAGQNIFYSIKSLDIVPYASQNNRFGKNLNGDFYHYTLEVQNGEREYLTYYTAYRLLEEQKLLSSTYPDIPAIDKVYSIVDVQFQKLKLDYSSVPQFSIILIFNENILIAEEMVGIEILEQKEYKDYLLYISIPNTLVAQEFSLERQYEYLKDIQLTNDSRYISRALLKARFNPLLTNLAPHVTKIDERRIIITFFYRAGFDAIAYREQKNIVFNPFIEEERQEQSIYTKKINTYRTGFDTLVKEQDSDIEVLVSELQNLIKNINIDSIQISSDGHLARILELREQIKSYGYTAIIAFVNKTFNDSSNALAPARMRELLTIAEGFTGKRSEIEIARQLKLKF